MKYANFCSTVSTNVNIGDYLQFLAISFLYDQMGIHDDDVYYLGVNDIIDYNGDKIVLPVNFSIPHFVKDGRIAFSPQIIPVFIAVKLGTVNRHVDLDAFLKDEYNRSYFMRHSPIGCRDEATYNYFRNFGIPAYINGCLTAIFPKTRNFSGENIVFVDAPKALLQWMPESLFNSPIIFMSQQYTFSEDEIRDYRKIFEFVRSRYDFYKEKTRLIVTSRLHVALPCVAYGIPVILAKDVVDERFSFIEKYLPIYNREQYQNIDWSPKTPDIEYIKEMLKNLAINRIRHAMDSAKAEKKLTLMFEARDKQKSYQDPHTAAHRNWHRFEEYASKYWAPKGNELIRYALWGANINTAEYWKNLIETKYPNSKLSAMFDRYRKNEVLGISAKTPDALQDMPDVYVVVCAVSAVSDALALFKRLGIEEERYVIVSDCFISQDDINEKRLTVK